MFVLFYQVKEIKQRQQKWLKQRDTSLKRSSGENSTDGMIYFDFILYLYIFVICMLS